MEVNILRFFRASNKNYDYFESFWKTKELAEEELERLKKESTIEIYSYQRYYIAKDMVRGS